MVDAEATAMELRVDASATDIGGTMLQVILL